MSLLVVCLLALEDTGKDDLKAFRQYLEKTYPGKKWQRGPAQVSSPELEKAYPGRRFYFVQSTPPGPTGVTFVEREAIERQRREYEAWRMTYLSALAELVDGRFKVLAGSDDFKDGLMVVKSEADARLAAAAILTLQMRKLSGFGTLGAEQVKVTKTDKGWTCQFGRIYYFSGTVTFDAAGKLSGVSAHFFLPPPE